MDAAVEPLQESVTIAAPRREVFAALTDADLVRRWFRAWAGCEIVDAEFGQPERGETFRVLARERDGEEVVLSGEALHVADDTLVVTMSLSSVPSYASVAYITLDNVRGGSTRVTVEHRDIEIIRVREEWRAFWAHVLSVMQRGIPRIAAARQAPEVTSFLEGRAPRPTSRRRRER